MGNPFEVLAQQIDDSSVDTDNSHISHTSTNAHNLHFKGNKNGNGQILGDALVCTMNTNSKMDTPGSVFRDNNNQMGIKLGQMSKCG